MVVGMGKDKTRKVIFVPGVAFYLFLSIVNGVAYAPVVFVCLARSSGSDQTC